MSKIRIDNSNTIYPNKYYIEIMNTKIEHALSNEAITFTSPVAPNETTDPSRLSIDLKKITEQFEVSGQIDLQSNKTSGWVTSVVNSANVVKDNLIKIFWSGGVVTMYYLDGLDNKVYLGIITNLKFTEQPEDAPRVGGISAPILLGVEITFLKASNATG